MRQILLFCIVTLLFSREVFSQSSGISRIPAVKNTNKNPAQLALQKQLQKTLQNVSQDPEKQKKISEMLGQGARTMARKEMSTELDTKGVSKEIQKQIQAKIDSLQEKIDSLQPKDSFPIHALPTYGIYGVGNVNTETFSNLNSSGKLAGYIRPYKGDKSYVTINFSFNVNATNTDSLLASTFLFPDVGNNSSYFNVDWTFKLPASHGQDIHLLTPFFEFSNKTIKGRLADSSRNFYTLSYVLGLRYQYLFIDKDDKVSFSIAPFYSLIHVPRQNKSDYKYLFTGDPLSSVGNNVGALGVKVTFQYNNFSIFADYRTILSKNVPDKLTGFHPNIGVIFNAEIFER